MLIFRKILISMAKPLRRYIWLIDTVSRAGSISYGDIRRKWISSPVNDLGEQDYPKRTFLSHIEEIKELFGLSILCDRKNDYKYYIAMEESEPRREELIGSLSLSMKLLENQWLRERVQFTTWDFNNRHIPAILEAIEGKYTLEIAHVLDRGEYGNDEVEAILADSPEDVKVRIPEEEFISHSFFPRITRLQPYYLEFVNHTWFVLGYAPWRRRMEAFRLARISALAERDDIPFFRDDRLSFDDVRDKIISRRASPAREIHDDSREYILFNGFNR